MKPQNLQDAIKAAALKKRNRVDSGVWKAPPVRQHKMSAEEFAAEKKNAGAKKVAPMVAAVEPVAGFTLEDRDRLLREMKELREKVEGGSGGSGGGSSNGQVQALRSEVAQLKELVRNAQSETEQRVAVLRQGGPSSSTGSDGGADVEDLKEEVATLQVAVRELQKFRQEVADINSFELGALRKEIATVKAAVNSEEVASLRKELDSLKERVKKSGSRHSTPARQRTGDEERMSVTKTDAKSPARKKSITKISANALLGESTNTPTKSPKKSKIPLLVKPHTIEALAQAQRKDKALKEYLKSQTGLPYTYKSMAIKDCPTLDAEETKHIVLFEGRVYVPAKLRKETLEYLVTNHPYDSKTVLEQRCIWPDCVEELKALKESRRSG